METSPTNGGKGATQGDRRPGQRGQNLPESQETDQGRGAPQSPETGRVMRSGGERYPGLWGGSAFDTMARLSREMDQLMDSFFGSRFGGFPSRFGSGSLFGEGGRSRGGMPEIWAPQIDVRQKGDNIVINAEIPGVPREAIQIEASEEGIAISGERQETREENETERGYQFSERRYGSFYRNIPLPEGANVEEAKATMRDGVLEITVPVKATQQRRQIQISS